MFVKMQKNIKYIKYAQKNPLYVLKDVDKNKIQKRYNKKRYRKDIEEIYMFKKMYIKKYI